MTASRVVLISVAGPRGHVDVGVRDDMTLSQLAADLGSVIGLAAQDQPAAAHQSPPRPGAPGGWRQLPPGAPLAASGVVDGDLITFAPAAAPRSTPRAGTAPASTAPASTVTGETGR